MSLPPTKAGDLLLTHRDSFPSTMIVVGQHARGYHPEVAHWSHCGIVVSDEGDLVEALTRGVARTHVDKYRHVEHRLANTTDDSAARERVVAFAEHAVGRRYGFTEIAALGLYLAMGTSLRVTIDNQLICSALCAEALSRTDAIFPKEPLWMVPADLALYYNVR